MFGPFRRDDPNLIHEFQDELNRLVKRLWHAGISTAPFDGQDWAPAWDVVENDTSYTAYVELVGMQPDDITVSCVDRTLTVKGTKPQLLHDEPQPTCLRRERRFGAFARTIQLPEAVDTDKITASCRNGLLTVTLPKIIDPAKQAVRVKVEED